MGKLLRALPGIKIIKGGITSASIVWAVIIWLINRGSTMTPNDMIVGLLLLACVSLIIGNFIHWWELKRLKDTFSHETAARSDEVSRGIAQFDADRMHPNIKAFGVHMFVAREMVKEMIRLGAGATTEQAVRNLKDRFRTRFDRNPMLTTTSADGGQARLPDRDAYSIDEVERALDRWSMIDINHV